MCGIAGFYLNDGAIDKFPARRFADELLMGIEHRGRHATGFLSVSNNGRNKKPKVILRKQDITASDFVKVHQLPLNTRAALLHTRFATQGPCEVMTNNHPVMWNTCYVVHNGHISNDDQVVKDCGIEDARIGEVDSFAIPAALVHKGYANHEELAAGLHMLQGGFAIAMIDPVVLPGEVVLAKGENSPLSCLYTEHGIFWASERKVLEDTWGKVLGTPPKKTIHNFEEEGFFFFGTGEYVRFKANEGATQGRFEVNRRPFQPRGGGYSGAYDGIKTWTCFPNVSECYFGKECGNCTKMHCRCYSQNTWHPRMNRGLDWDTVLNNTEVKNAGKTARQHFKKHKLSKRDVEAWGANTQPHILRPRSSGPAIRSHSGQDFAKCDFCTVSAYFPIRNMTSIYSGEGTKYRCDDCHNKMVAERERNKVGTESEERQLDIMIHAYEDIAERWCEIVDDAFVTVGYNHGISTTLVNYIVFLQKKADSRSPWGEFQRKIRDEFKEAIDEAAELARRERVVD